MKAEIKDGKLYLIPESHTEHAGIDSWVCENSKNEVEGSWDHILVLHTKRFEVVEFKE